MCHIVGVSHYGCVTLSTIHMVMVSFICAYMAESELSEMYEKVATRYRQGLEAMTRDRGGL